MTYLLSPRLQPESDINAYWHRDREWDTTVLDDSFKLEEEASQELFKIFTGRRYGYASYVNDAELEQFVEYTVLGRTVKAEDSLSRPGDRLLLPVAR